MNVADFLLECADPRATALVSESHQFSYAELRDVAARVAGELVAAGVVEGDRVGLLARNSLFWVAAYLGILKTGAVAVPFSTTATDEDLNTQQALAGCRALCAETPLARRHPSLLGDGSAWISEQVLSQPGPRAWPSGAADMDQADAALMSTSGTTARPRAVRVTHRNIQANTSSIIEYLGLTATERVMAVLPFYYCFGTSLLHTHLRVGGTLVVANSFMYPETVLDLMAAQRCTGFAGVPSIYQTLLRNSSFARRQWPALRKLQQAGGKLAAVLIDELRTAVPSAEVYVMYGQTEATARLSYLPPELLTSKLGSIGRGIPGVALKVLDEDGAPVEPGQTGEIVAWGDNISPGYWCDAEATSQKFVNGALRTGDLATVDNNGFIYIVDRKSDFIKSFGYRVSSQQVEACILELSEIVAAAVVGIPDLQRGEAIVAFVTLRDGANLKPNDVLAHCAAHLAHHMRPKLVVVLERLPVNPQGKVMKTELRKLALAEAGPPE
jgi:acyl-CoA synthetase (AMP-forming)/AMP-acid ligase II